MTVTVKVTDCPKLDGLLELLTAAVVETRKPFEMFSRTATPPTARSGRPSPLKSAITVSVPEAPRDLEGWKVPSPLPSNNALDPPAATSSLWSPLKSPTTIGCHISLCGTLVAIRGSKAASPFSTTHQV